MIKQILFSVLVGIMTPTIYLKYCKRRLKIKKMHVHHTVSGIFSSLGSIPLILRDISLGVYMLGFGIGMIIHHRISEKNFKMITRS